LAIAGVVVLGPIEGEAQRGANEHALAPPLAAGAFDRLPNGKPDLNGIWRIDVSLSDITTNIVRVGDTAVEGDERAIRRFAPGFTPPRGAPAR
jgi:hypothetical protein